MIKHVAFLGMRQAKLFQFLPKRPREMGRAEDGDDSDDEDNSDDDPAEAETCQEPG